MNYIYAYLTTNFLIQLKVDYNQNHFIFKLMMHISYAFNTAWIANQYSTYIICQSDNRRSDFHQTLTASLMKHTRTRWFTEGYWQVCLTSDAQSPGRSPDTRLGLRLRNHCVINIMPCYFTSHFS